MSQTIQITDNPHYGMLGGSDAVDRLVEAFYRRMDTDPAAAVIRAMHVDDLAPVKRVLKLYLAQWLGGPDHYARERGHPRLRMRHLPFHIGTPERDAWMHCMRGALAEVVTDAKLRAHLELAFFKIADHIRNDKGASHEHHRS